jgi:hypothetical protein
MLVVKEVFKLGPRLVVVPDYYGTRAIQKLTLPLEAELEAPSGETLACQVNLSNVHFNTRNSDINDRWRTVVDLKGVLKSEVQVGSRLYIFDESAFQVLGVAVDRPSK